MSINDEEKMAKKLQKAATLESTGVWLTLLPIAGWLDNGNNTFEEL